MRASSVKTISVSLPVALVILIQALALFPTRTAAQCPTMSAEGATVGITQFNAVKSQMWYNDGIWWGAFSDSDTGIFLYSFPNNSTTKGPIIDGTVTGIPDALWDGTNLFIAVWKSVSTATLYKYTYNSATKTYSLISGFPIPLPLGNGLQGSTSALVLQKDSTGKLWATYTGTQGGTADGKIHVMWSTSADHKVWNTTGAELESGLVPNTIEISAITHFGGNKIGIVWSNQPAREIAFRYHIDGQTETTWSTKEVIDSGLGPRGLGPVSDDHLAIKAAPDGRLFLIAKDNDNDGTVGHLNEGRLWLYIRSAAGVWGNKTIVQPDFSQLPTRPVLLLDNINNQAYVLYSDASPSGAQRTFITHTSMSSPSFDFPCVFTSVATSNPTSTKQDVSPTTGIMAAASTGSTGSGEIIFRSVTLTTQAHIDTVSPSSKTMGTGAFIITVNGTSFADGSFVQWNGNDRLTTFVSSTQLTAEILPEDISVAGTAAITVSNPATGAVSNSVNFTVNNPAPTLSSISPTNQIAGDPAFNLTVNGTNFVFGSVVRINGNSRTTSFLSSTQLSAQITAADILTAGAFPITVFNPTPGGGASSAINLTVSTAPVPTLSSLNPTTKIAGDAAFTLTVNGTNFINGSIVRFNGSNRTTTFVSGTQLTAQITAADVQATGAFPITVLNPAGPSNAINLTVNNPTPTLSNISPTSKNTGDPAFTLTVNGTNFVNGSVVSFNSSNRTTTFVSGTQLTAQITAADILTAGSFPVAVFNPAPGGGTSNAINLTVNNPLPTITTLNPASKGVGGVAFSLTVNGIGFVGSSVVNWNGQPRTTSFLSSTQLIAQITATDISAVGTANVTVSSPAPGGGVSNSVSFAITANVGYEADVAPRPNGSNTGSVGVTDWVQMGRFAAGLDTPSCSGSEFQRADVAPKGTLGNGSITVTDWSQAGRYAAGLDPVVPMGGPICTPVPNPTDLGALVMPRTDKLFSALTASTIAVENKTLQAGQNGTVNISLNAQGNENALGFSVHFDKDKLTYVSASMGTDAASAGATMAAPNLSAIASGNVGITLLLPAGSVFSAGTRQLVVLTFTVPANGNGSTVISFGNAPVPMELGDVDANVIDATFVSGTINIAPVPNAVPSITGTSPTSAITGGPAFTLTVNGNGFVSGSTVRFNDSDRPTTFVSSTQLTAQITAADISSAGSENLTVFNPTPGGGVSNTRSFTITNDPSLRIIRAAGAIFEAGHNNSVTIELDAQGDENSLGFSLNFDTAKMNYVSAVLGSDASGASLIINALNVASGNLGVVLGLPPGTTFSAGTRRILVLTFNVPSSSYGSTTINFGDVPIGREITNAGPPVVVLGASYASGTININQTPTVSSLSPTSALAGGPAFSLTVNGSNFVNGSVVRFGGSDRTTTFVSATQLTAQITAADIQTTGTSTVVVVNPGGVSNSVNFAVENPAPSISGLSPSSVVAGGNGFSLTVNGSNFINGSVVRWNGIDRATFFISSTQLAVDVSAADVQAAGSAEITVFNPSPGGGVSGAITFSISVPPPPLTVQFSQASFSHSEGGGSAVISVSRSGNAAAAASVDFAIDPPLSVPQCSDMNGLAAQNCDYMITAGRLQFTPGETTKSFTVLLVDDFYGEGDETLSLKLANASGAILGPVSTAVLSIIDNDTPGATTNPIDQAGVFVRQHYLDFLNREADPGGLDYWTNQITQCGSDVNCERDRRIGVSGAFFVELEFQRTGSVIYRLHKAAYAQRPAYLQFMLDRSQLEDGPQLAATTLAFANNFVLRPEFKIAYPDSMTAEAFVNQLFDSAQLMNSAAMRQQQIDAITSDGKTRAQVLLDLIETPEFKEREYNPSFVLMQYFGYLRRDPEIDGFNFWLDVLNNREPDNYRGMICAFLTSAEYQKRFGATVTRFNSQCGQ